MKNIIDKIKNIGKKKVSAKQQEDAISVLRYHKFMINSGMFDDAEDRAVRREWEKEIADLESSLPDFLREIATNPNNDVEYILNKTFIDS